MERRQRRAAVTAISVYVATVACSGDEHTGAEPPPEEYLGLTVPQPGKGLQVRSLGASILPGEDVE